MGPRWASPVCYATMPKARPAGEIMVDMQGVTGTQLAALSLAGSHPVGAGIRVKHVGWRLGTCSAIAPSG